MADKSEFSQLVAKHIGYDKNEVTYDMRRVEYLAFVASTNDAKCPISDVVHWAAGTKEPNPAVVHMISGEIRASNAYAKTVNQPRNWVKIGQDMEATFSIPCRGVYHTIRHVGWLGCTDPDDAHGHIELMCEDGYAYLKFRCYSQEGVGAYLAQLGEEYKVIADLSEIKALPKELTEKEKEVLNSPEKMEKMTKFGFWS